ERSSTSHPPPPAAGVRPDCTTLGPGKATGPRALTSAPGARLEGHRYRSVFLGGADFFGGFAGPARLLLAAAAVTPAVPAALALAPLGTLAAGAPLAPPLAPALSPVPPA